MLKFLAEHQWIIIVLIVWMLPWKGVALWRAAQNGHKKWFVALFIFNTMAILEIIYLFIFSMPKAEEPVAEIPNNLQRRPKRIS